MKSGFSGIILVLIVAFLIGGAGLLGYVGKDFISKNLSIDKEESKIESQDTTSKQDDKSNSAKEPEFCKQYGTFEVKKSDLLKTHEVGPGETLRTIAKKELSDETKATDLISVNPQLSSYEIDDELPYKLKVFIPNEQYNEEGITNYMKTRGNIQFNKDKPMFGVNAPNSGTGPFIISDKIENDIKQVKEGDCVEIIYGSKDYDPQKIVFEVKLQ
jgi:hypothetical protein